MKPRRETNREATRAALLAVARKHFARHGYAGAELVEIAAAARVTTGAVYHHFKGKKELFLAVAEALEQEILAVAASVTASDPLLQLKQSFQKLIDICAAPDVQRITFVEAPQVIGPEAWRKVELRYALGALEGLLSGLNRQGRIQAAPVDLVARLLLALLREASAEVVKSKHDPGVRKSVDELVERVFDAIIAPC